jgi:uncharacterized membrane protein YbjE (DUF340 family)
VFAGLSRVPGARGRVIFGDREFGIAEMPVTENLAVRAAGGWFPLAGAIPLAVAEDDGAVTLMRDFAALKDGSRLLIAIPLEPFHDGRDSFAAIAERVQSR